MTLVAVALVGWTFLAASCGGVITMSVAHADEWPPGATVALVILALVWLGLPTLVFWRRRQRSQ